MAHPYHHALSSVRKWGGVVEDYIELHAWFDESKSIIADFRHRALRHHAEGIFMLERLFGATITLSTGKVIPTRWIGEQHVREDLGRIPSFTDWAKAIRPEPWMGRAVRLDDTLGRDRGDDILPSPSFSPMLRRHEVTQTETIRIGSHCVTSDSDLIECRSRIFLIK